MLTLEFSHLDGAIIDDTYEIKEHIASGGMGDVFKAYDRVLHRTVAIKLMRSFCATDPDLVKRFMREAEITSSLTHRNIVQVFDAGEHEQIPYFVMEYVDHPTLAAIIEVTPEGLPLGDIVKITQGLCEGLGFAHQKGLIHRDLKPMNVFVTPKLRAILADFGLVRVLDQSGLTQTGAVVGTPSYMPPEVVEGGKADNRSDIYQVGLILYEMLSGKELFPKGYLRFTDGDKFHNYYQSPSHQRPDIPSWVDRVLIKCLHIDPELRYQSVAHLASDLAPDADTDALGETITRPLPPASSQALPPLEIDSIFSRQRVPIVATAAALVLLVVLAIYWLTCPRLAIVKSSAQGGLAAVRLVIETNLPSQATLICRQQGDKTVTVDSSNIQRRHELIARDLTYRNSCTVEALVTLPEGGNTLSTGRIELPLLSTKNLGQVRVKKAESAIELDLTCDGSLTISAQLGKNEKRTTLGRKNEKLIIAKTSNVNILKISAGLSDWDQKTLLSLPLKHKSHNGDLSHALSLATWSAVVKDELFNRPIRDEVLLHLKRAGGKRLCLTWLPTNSIKSLEKSVRKLRAGKITVDLLLFLTRSEKRTAVFDEVISSLAQSCKGGVVNYYISTGIDLIGWDEQPTDYVKFLLHCRRLIKAKDPVAKILPGTFMMKKDTPIYAALRKEPRAFSDGASFFHPIVTNDFKWSLPARYTSITKPYSYAKLPPTKWAIFLGMPQDNPPVYETGLGIFFTVPRAFANRGDPALMAKEGSSVETMSQSERVSLTNFFVPPALSKTTLCKHLLANSLQGLTMGMDSICWAIEASVAYGFYEKSETSLGSLARIRAIGQLSSILSGAQRVDRRRTIGGLAIEKGQAEIYRIEYESGDSFILWPRTDKNCLIKRVDDNRSLVLQKLPPTEDGSSVIEVELRGSKAREYKLTAPTYLRIL